MTVPPGDPGPIAPHRVLVAGIGNVFLSDDGFGPEVTRRLLALRWPDGVRVVDYGIRGLHLAYDLLDPWDVLVLVDALPGEADTEGAVVVLEIGADDIDPGAQVDAHGMAPAAVLASVAGLGGRLPRRTLLVGCRVAETGEGMGLTPPVAAVVDEAVAAVRALVDRELTSTGVA
jgi:hydrogenase maturation protease